MCEIPKRLFDDAYVQWLVGIGTEGLGKVLGVELAEHDVAVCNRQWPAAPVTGRAGVGAGRIRPHAHAHAVEMQNGAATGGHRVDAHNGHAHAHAGDLGIEGALESSGEVRDIGRRATHVEGDDAIEAGHLAGAHGADDAACRPRQDAVFALKQTGIGQTAVRLHEHQPHAL